MPNLSRVQEEIDNGTLWKARDRLLGLLSTYPTSQEILELLGEVLYKMGDIPESGRYWYLTEGNSKEKEEAILIYEKKCGNKPCSILSHLYIRGQLNDYGPSAKKRIQNLINQCSKAKSLKIKPYLVPVEVQEFVEPTRWSIWKEKIKMTLSLIILIGPWLVGFFTLGIWLTSFITPALGEYLLTHWFDLLDLVKVN